jgi:hypothetical protein
MHALPDNRQVPTPSDVSATPTPILVKRALTCRRLRDCGSPFPPGHELVMVRRVGGLGVVLAEIRRREVAGVR